MHYKPILIKGMDQDGNTKNFYQSDLNNVIREFFGVYLTEVTAGLSTFLDRYAGRDFVKSLPLIVAGGGAKLVGLELFLQKAFEGREILVVTPDTIGARDPSMVNLLGMLMCATSYSGSKEDIQKGVATVSRDSSSRGKKEGRRLSRSSIDDSL